MDTLGDYDSSSSEDDHDDDKLINEQQPDLSKDYRNDCSHDDDDKKNMMLYSLLPSPDINQFTNGIDSNSVLVNIATKDYLTEKQNSCFKRFLEKEVNNNNNNINIESMSKHLHNVAIEIFGKEPINLERSQNKNDDVISSHETKIQKQQNNDHDDINNPQLFTILENSMNKRQRTKSLEEWEYIPGLLVLEENARMKQYS